MAGYWPSSFFCVFMDRDEVDRASLISKGFIIWEKTPKHDLALDGVLLSRSVLNK